MEMPGWNESGYADEAWLQAEMVAAPGGKLTVQTNPMIEIMDTVRPVAIARIAPGVHILDMGQNMVGWLSMRVQGKRGQTVRLRFAETLKPDGSLYMDNLREAEVTDTYTIADEREHLWEPAFTYHGFRYVEITGYPETPSLSDFEGRVVYDRMATTGSFTTSDTTINRVYRNAYRGIRSNYRGMPTDCPSVTSARAGWATGRQERSVKVISSTMACSMPSGCRTSRIRNAGTVRSRTSRPITGRSTTTTSRGPVPISSLRRCSTNGSGTCSPS